MTGPSTGPGHVRVLLVMYGYCMVMDGYEHGLGLDGLDHALAAALPPRVPPLYVSIMHYLTEARSAEVCRGTPTLRPCRVQYILYIKY